MNRSLYVFALVVCVYSTSQALDIVVTYDEPQSQAPAFDPNGTRLRALVDSAVAIFEDIIEDDHTLNLAFTWGDLGPDGTLGLATTLDTDNGRPTFSRMRFSTNPSVNWFLDPTPDDHSEFSLIQSTVADLTPATLAEAYSGTPPEQLEVGFAGVRNTGFNTTDLLSVIIHEVGHAVGLGTLSIGASANDGDFDVPSRFLGGETAGIRVSTDEDRAHLAAPRSAMFPVIIPDIRRLPSATDIFAIASAAGWQELDLPRKDFVGSGSWNDPSRWIGNREPDQDDQVVVRTGGEVSIDSTAVADSVQLIEETRLVVEGGLSANELSFSDAAHRFVIGDDFAGVEIAETAALDGSLFVELSQTAVLGESYTLLSADNLIGEFEAIDVSLPVNNRGLVVDVREDSLEVTVAQVGDTNTDGAVDFQDFLTLSRNFGGEGSWRDGNFDNDRTVDFQDFLNFSANFGSTVAALPEATITSVPEPSCLHAIGLLSLVLWSCQGRQRC